MFCGPMPSRHNDCTVVNHVYIGCGVFRNNRYRCCRRRRRRRQRHHHHQRRRYIISITALTGARQVFRYDPKASAEAHQPQHSQETRVGKSIICWECHTNTRTNTQLPLSTQRPRPSQSVVLVSTTSLFVSSPPSSFACPMRVRVAREETRTKHFAYGVAKATEHSPAHAEKGKKNIHTLAAKPKEIVMRPPAA